MSQERDNKGGKRLPKETGSAPRRRPAGQKSGSPKPKRTGKDLIRHRIFVGATVVAAIIVAAFVLWNIFSAPPDVDTPNITRPPQTTTTVDPETGEEIEVEVPGLSADRKKEFYTFLLVGQDTFGGGNTDTMMLAAYDVPNQTLNVMSLPRDTFVNYNGRKVLLNSVYNRAGGARDTDKGIAALKKEVEEFTGIPVDYHVIVQWDAVGELVNAIDGVEFDVPRRMYYNDLSQGFKIDLQPGRQHMDGSKAMQLIRWRHNSDDSGHILNSGYANGDLGRIETQQDFMKAIIKKCLQPGVLLTNLGEYITIFQKNVVTNLSVSNMTYFAKSAVGGLDMDNVEFITMPWKNAGDGSHVLPVASELLKAVNAGFNPYKEDIRSNELDIVTSIDLPAKSTSSAEPSETPDTEPSESPDASQTPTPTNTPNGDEPVAPPGVTTTPRPSESPKASATPNPSASAEPSQAPAESQPPSTAPPEPTPPPATQPVEEEPLLPPGV